MKSFIDELTGYRVKVEKDGKEIVNVPGILALPGLLIAPKASIIGMVAAPLLGCSIHLENENGRDVDIGKAVKDAANTVADTAATAANGISHFILDDFYSSTKMMWQKAFIDPWDLRKPGSLKMAWKKCA